MIELKKVLSTLSLAVLLASSSVIDVGRQMAITTPFYNNGSSHTVLLPAGLLC